MAKCCFNLTSVVMLTLFSCLLSSNTVAAEVSILRDTLTEVRDYNTAARELSKTDAFNIRTALRKAIHADSPREEFHWRNSYTEHRGSITLLEFIRARSDGTACVDFIHTFYPAQSSPKKSKHTICRDKDGNWEGIAKKITAKIPRSAGRVKRDAPSRVDDSISALQKYTVEARELNKMDAFNIRVTLRRAIDAESPGDNFHWRNPHTQNRGTISLTGFIEPRDDGGACVDFIHTYYPFGADASKTADSVCRDPQGRWQLGPKGDTIAGSKGKTKPATRSPRYNAETVYKVQRLLTELSYAPGPIDGIYGRKTRRAIRLFQRDERLPVTGEISDNLLARLRQSIATLEHPLPKPIKQSARADLPSTLHPEVVIDRTVRPRPHSDTDNEDSTAVAPTGTSVSLGTLTAGETPRSPTVEPGSSRKQITLTSAGADLGHSPQPDDARIEKASTSPTGMARYTTEGTLTDLIDASSLRQPLAADQDLQADKALSGKRRPYLLTIDGIDFTLIPETQAVPIDSASVPTSYLMRALKPEWEFIYDWHHLPWSGSYSDISKNITRVKSHIHRLHQAASRENRFFVVAAHSWGGVLAYRAISELYKEKSIPVGAIDVLVTMGCPLNAQYAEMKNIAANYGRWSGAQALTEPVRAWLNYWILEDDFSGAVPGITNTQLPYDYGMEVFPHNAYHQAEQFQRAIEWDVKTSLQQLDLHLARIQAAPAASIKADHTAKLETAPPPSSGWSTATQ